MAAIRPRWSWPSSLGHARAHREAVAHGDKPGDLSAVYAGRGAQRPADSDARDTVAGTWATSKLTDYAAAALFGVTVPTLLVLVVYEGFLIADKRASWLATAATVGTTLGVLATGAFVAYLRSALLNTAARKRFGLFWDVVTFWPRACHPFGPPSYAERFVPDYPHPPPHRRHRAGRRRPGRRAAGSRSTDATRRADYREEHSPVLLVGYSQGCPIAAAVVAQLPNEVRERVALLTMAAPVRRLYGRAFPAYFGTAQLDRLKTKLTSEDGTVRWRNAIRRSDYIGGWALDEDYSAASAVDREIYDPPVLWTDADPAPPPMHLHSDWFRTRRPCARRRHGRDIALAGQARGDQGRGRRQDQVPGQALGTPGHNADLTHFR